MAVLVSTGIGQTVKALRKNDKARIYHLCGSGESFLEIIFFFQVGEIASILISKWKKSLRECDPTLVPKPIGATLVPKPIGKNSV